MAGTGLPKLLFVSGPMTGFPELNKPSFHEAAKLLREHGYHVISPAELCDRDIHHAVGHRCSRRDLQALVTFPIDGLATLPDGPLVHPELPPSKGMAVERHLAESCLLIPIAPVEIWLDFDPMVGVPTDNEIYRRVG